MPNMAGANYIPSNPLVGALAILVGARSTETDAMYSGHTYVWILTALMVGRYTNHGILAGLMWVLNITGIFFLLSVRDHYSADVVVAVVVCVLAFLVYHLFLDVRYLPRWQPGYVFTLTEEELDQKPAAILPLKVLDKEGNVVAMRGLPEDSKRLPGMEWVIYPGREATPARMGMFRIFKWLDGEEIY